MSMQQQMMLECFERYHTRGMELYRSGDGVGARKSLLQAAEVLYKLAAGASGQLRDSRIERADKLVDLAKGISAGGRKKASLGPAGADRKQPIGQDEEDGKQWSTAEVPDVSFDDVAGLAEVKSTVRKRVIYPFTHPEVTARYKKQAGGGVMLYGPPGTGKTLIAKAIANEAGAAFFSVRCSDIMSKWVGQAEENLKALFGAAGEHDRAVIFFDEAEALLTRRGGGSTVMNRVVPEFLSQVDGVTGRHEGLLLLGATNRPWDIDDAALRPGRFGELVYIPLPDDPARRWILCDTLDGVPMSSEIDFDALARATEGYSGADCVALGEAAKDGPYEREIKTGQQQELTAEDLAAAVARVRPSVTEKALAKYEKYQGR